MKLAGNIFETSFFVLFFFLTVPSMTDCDSLQIICIYQFRGCCQGRALDMRSLNIATKPGWGQRGGGWGVEEFPIAIFNLNN